MNRDQEPSPEFLENLEWQVRTALHRQARFSAPARRQDGGTMKLMAVILVSALFGAGGVVVKDQVQEGKVQEVLLAQVEMEIQLAELQVEAVRGDLDDLQRQVAGGMVEDDALVPAQAALREAVTHLNRLQLDREEIRLAGREPQDMVSAPLVRGRDFVTERLDLDVQVVEEQIHLAERDLARVQQLQAAGMIRADEASYGAAARLQQVRLRLDGLQQRRQLRRRFLAGEVTAAEATSQALVIEADADLAVQAQGVDMAQHVLQALEARAAQGLVNESDLRQARLELMRRELARKLAELKLEQIRGGGGAGR